MKRLVILGVAALTAFGFAAMGCSSDSKPAATTAGTGGTDSNGGAGTTGGATSTSTAKTGGTTSTSTSTAAATGGATAGGSTGTSASCGTTKGTVSQTTTFGTALTPYAVNSWGWGTAAAPTLTTTTTGPTGLDCSAGCAKLSANYADGVGAYAAAVMAQYFGTTATSVSNLYGETITVKAAVVVTAASGATAPTLAIELFGQDLDATVNANIWLQSLGATTALDPATGFHTITYVVANTPAPSWAPSRTVCADQLHTIGVRIQNSAAITATTAASVDLYIQSISIQ